MEVILQVNMCTVESLKVAALVLCCILLLLMIYLVRWKKNTVMYANDSTLYFAAQTADSLSKSFHNDLVKMCNWVKEYEFVLNVEKQRPLFLEANSN